MVKACIMLPMTLTAASVTRSGGTQGKTTVAWRLLNWRNLICLEVSRLLVRARFEMPEYLELFHDSLMKIMLINFFSNVVVVGWYDIMSRVRV